MLRLFRNTAECDFEDARGKYRMQKSTNCCKPNMDSYEIEIARKYSPGTLMRTKIY